MAAKPYRLLVEALRRSSRVAIAKYAWSGRERLGVRRVRGDARPSRSSRPRSSISWPP
ncbi:Ku protein [Streptomyces sp. NPDC020192]|uniref:Ku protein n=1 Tax=Streptomyces sp. NPDC020192 TaxID=3365066 RepID=UPI0037BBA22F